MPGLTGKVRRRCGTTPVLCQSLEAMSSAHGSERGGAALPLGREVSTSWIRKTRATEYERKASATVASTGIVSLVDRRDDQSRQVRCEGDGKPTLFHRQPWGPARRRCGAREDLWGDRRVRKARQPTDVGRRLPAKLRRSATTLDWNSSIPSRGCGAPAFVLGIPQGRRAHRPTFLP